MTTKTNINMLDAAIRDRANHTGEQPQSTVTGLVDALAAIATSELGGSGNANYLRFDNGFQACWGIAATTVTTGAASNGVYVSGATTFTFPFAFVGAVPTIDPLARWVSGGQIWGAQVTAPNLINCSVSLVSPGATGTGYAGYIAVGRWK